MKIELLVNLTCNKTVLKKGHVIEKEEEISILDKMTPIQKLVDQGIIKIIEEKIIEEIPPILENEIEENFNGIIIDEKISKKPKKSKKGK